QNSRSNLIFRHHKPVMHPFPLASWRHDSGCVAGVLSDNDYRQKLAAAGFESIDIEATRVYNIGDAGEFLGAAGSDANAVGLDVQDKFISAFVRARKPAKADAC
ncbi:MAG: hypothetical protein WB630_17060, partial [Candidatus Acidiferrales bacterium]